MQDPNHTARTRRKAKSSVAKRIKAVQKVVKARFASIPRKKSTRKSISNNAEAFDYDITPDQLAQLESDIDSAFSVSLIDNATALPAYYEEYVELATRSGTLDESISFNQVIATAATLGVLVKGVEVREIEPTSYVIGDTYNKRLQQNKVSSFGTLKKTAQNSASDIFGVISNGIKAKLAPAIIASEISGRFKKTTSYSEQSVDTDINRIYTQARMETGAIISDETGLSSGVLHISALTSTTRQHHADRHGKVFARGDQNAWWESGGNRYNCKCSVRPILTDKKGNVLDKLYQERIETEGIDFFGRPE